MDWRECQGGGQPARCATTAVVHHLLLQILGHLHLRRFGRELELPARRRHPRGCSECSQTLALISDFLLGDVEVDPVRSLPHVTRAKSLLPSARSLAASSLLHLTAGDREWLGGPGRGGLLPLLYLLDHLLVHVAPRRSAWILAEGIHPSHQRALAGDQASGAHAKWRWSLALDDVTLVDEADV